MAHRVRYGPPAKKISVALETRSRIDEQRNAKKAGKESESTDYVTSTLSAQIIEKYFDNDLEYLYYKFLDTWHTRARDIEELFKFVDYIVSDSIIRNFNMKMSKAVQGD